VNAPARSGPSAAATQLSSPPLVGFAEGVPQPLVPEEMRGKLAGAEHIARYLWASKLVVRCRTLDAGCATGYGSRMLSEGGALEVVGVDVDEAVLKVASHSAPDNVRFEVADIGRLPFDSGSFERVVCFETIEHVEDPDAALDELKRVLAPGGLLILSSPNPDRYLPSEEHRQHRYKPAELRAVLEARFKDVRLLQQHAMLASVTTEQLVAGALVRPSVSSTVDAAAGSESYTLALAGDALPDTSATTVALTTTVEIRELLEHVASQAEAIRGGLELRAELEDARRDRREALQLLARRERELAQLPVLADRVLAAQAQLHEQRSALSAEIDDLGARIADLGAELERRRALLESLENSMSWRITAPLRALKRLLRRR
jgi:2-polyprenyl-3-methyl-5-hydroxy-6-metoxy-1,4-benzoquinol methylase